MCRIKKTIYSVCCHAKKKLRHCAAYDAQQAWLARWDAANDDEDTALANCLRFFSGVGHRGLLATMPPSCDEDRTHAVVLGWCWDCDAHLTRMHGVCTRDEAAVRLYWAYMTRRRWGHPVQAAAVPLAALLDAYAQGGDGSTVWTFGDDWDEEESEMGRSEIRMLARTLGPYCPGVMHTREGAPLLLQYVESIRAATIEWARTGPPPFLDRCPTGLATLMPEEPAPTPEMEMDEPGLELIEPLTPYIHVNTEAYRALCGETWMDDMPPIGIGSSSGNTLSSINSMAAPGTVTARPHRQVLPELVPLPESDDDGDEQPRQKIQYVDNGIAVAVPILQKALAGRQPDRQPAVTAATTATMTVAATSPTTATVSTTDITAADDNGWVAFTLDESRGTVDFTRVALSPPQSAPALAAGQSSATTGLLARSPLQVVPKTAVAALCVHCNTPLVPKAVDPCEA